jgi:predicted phosphodiesterase
VGDSLDGHQENRDAFWKVLVNHHVQAFISGHIHFYYKEVRDGVYQICDGNAGNGSAEKHQTFLDVVVGSDQAQVKVWQNTTNGSAVWHLAETIPLTAAKPAQVTAP